MEEAPPQFFHTGQRAPFTSHILPTRSADIMETGSLSSGSTLMSLDSPVPSPFHARPLSPPFHSLPPVPATDVMEVEQSPPTRSLANPNNGSFCWDNIPPTHNPGDMRMEEGPVSQPSRSPAHLPASDPSIPCRRNGRVGMRQDACGPTRGSFSWNNSSSALDPSGGHIPPPQTRSSPHHPASRNPHLQTWGTNINAGPASGKTYYGSLEISAEH